MISHFPTGFSSSCIFPSSFIGVHRIILCSFLTSVLMGFVFLSHSCTVLWPIVFLFMGSNVTRLLCLSQLQLPLFSLMRPVLLFSCQLFFQAKGRRSAEGEWEILVRSSWKLIDCLGAWKSGRMGYIFRDNPPPSFIFIRLHVNRSGVRRQT